MAAGTKAWMEAELAGSEFADERFGKRLRVLLTQLGGAVGESLPMACQDWAATKAAYRFFSNERVSEADILGGHFDATRRRFAATNGTVLVVQDTTEFSFQRDDGRAIGFTTAVNSGKDKAGRLRVHTVCGLLMHSSLVITADEGLPLGLAAIKFWSRDKFKGTAALKREVNPTRMPIETKESYRWIENLRRSTELLGDPARCVHVGDRESDIYELFCAAQELGTHFLVRVCNDRLAGDGRHTVADEMNDTVVQGLHHVGVRDSKGRFDTAALEIKFRRIRVLPPQAKQKRYPPLELTVIHAIERDAPKGRPPVDWKLITDLPVDSTDAVLQKLHWYALRWKIETFHTIRKSGCHVEEARLRTAERLVKLIAVFCILSWRIFWLTTLKRAAPEATPRLALTALEIEVFDRLVRDRGEAPLRSTIEDYLLRIARLGGYLARTRDPPPGNKVMWRGMTKRLRRSLRSHRLPIRQAARSTTR